MSVHDTGPGLYAAILTYQVTGTMPLGVTTDAGVLIAELAGESELLAHLLRMYPESHREEYRAVAKVLCAQLAAEGEK